MKARCRHKSLVIEGARLEANLVTDGVALEESLVTEGITLDASLVAKESTDDYVSSLEQLDESSSLWNNTYAKKKLVDMVASDIEYADIEPSFDSDTVSEVHHDTFENVFANEIQNRGKEEQDHVDYEQQHDLFASLINNLKCDVEKYNKVNREAKQANALLTNEIERYKEKEKHFAKEKTIKSEYCKKIKLLDEEI
nr:hypothetical protein [Tanacetum cinerariifolium]